MVKSFGGKESFPSELVDYLNGLYKEPKDLPFVKYDTDYKLTYF